MESSSKSPEILVPRRRPAQARSRAKYDRVLSCAREALVDYGFESFTFDEVSRRAEVPIGTLYQYFANKYVLICELDRQDTAEMLAEVERFSQRVPALQWPDFLEEFIDRMARVWRNDPSRRAVWHAVQSTPATRATAADTELSLLKPIAEIIEPLAQGLDAHARVEIAAFLVHTVVSLLNYSTMRSEESFDGVVEEIKRMLIAYLFAIATSA
ncbi:TetR family transcriptional regulator [Corynebacterium sp. HMSC074C01]|uniref:TetR family transcriptional regulator n=1 Tax=Corynebacterium sp. HMSC074C01 TaxID=1739482 RepID=UPI0008A61DFE|nr:TetR family transcriptional regulator [Corynebacterium sp. HMSC074C01]OFP65055.1 TetR family transcriptional regulator [Corynebacterium sp. HMSC074C01]